MSAWKGSHAAAIVVNRRGYVVGWNEGAEEVLGFRAQDVVGRACHHVLCGRDPNGAMVCHPWCALGSPEPRGALADEIILYPRTVHGETFRAALSVFPLEDDDVSRGWIVHTIVSAEPIRAAAGPAPAVRLVRSSPRRRREVRRSGIRRDHRLVR